MYSVLMMLVVGLYKIEATNVMFCPNLHPTSDFDEEAILGMWYIREYIFHKENVTKTEYNPYCPIVQIRKFEDYVSGGLLNRDLVSVKLLIILQHISVYNYKIDITVYTDILHIYRKVLKMYF